jgi:two-component system phosphate regulon sensor histidine kinase PhoR
VEKSRTGSGTGLGLSISKHIIEAHGGKIWAESDEGRGSVFYFVIPLLTT